MIELILEFVLEAAAVLIISAISLLLGISFESVEFIGGSSFVCFAIWLAFRSALREARCRHPRR